MATGIKPAINVDLLLHFRLDRYKRLEKYLIDYTTKGLEF